MKPIHEMTPEEAKMWAEKAANNELTPEEWNFFYDHLQNGGARAG